jgi:hypothetical protein
MLRDDDENKRSELKKGSVVNDVTTQIKKTCGSQPLELQVPVDF